MSSVDRSRLPIPGPPPTFRFPPVLKRQLPNGLRVWTIEHRLSPVLSAVLVVRSGAAADPLDRPGLAALTGDMLDEGSGHRSALDVQDALARLGADLDTEVSADATALLLTTLARHGRRALEILSDIAARPRLAEEDFLRVRDLRLNRLLQLRHVPSALADKAFLEHLYRDHPYGHLAIGTEAGLRGINLPDVVSFHASRVRPPGAVLILVGDLTHDDGLRAAAEAFGSWTDGSETAPVFDRDADLAQGLDGAGRGVAIVDRPRAPQAELRIGQVGSDRRDPQYHALVVLNAILGGQFVSRINMKLRQEKGLTYGARTAFEFRRGRGPFTLATSVDTAATVDAVREALAELGDIRGARPAEAGELALAKASLTSGYARHFESAEQLARAAAQLALYDLPDDYFDRFVPLVERVQVDEVTRVAQQRLDPDGLLTVIVGDYASMGPGLGALGIGEPTLVGGAT
ncbi:MAG: insulinase family protein [Acidobacteria bacterium]|nr:insulinase family protein [Acidobacteriota bacterium]